MPFIPLAMIQIIFIPVIIFSYVAGLVGGIWMLFYGQWLLVASVVIAGFFAPYLLSFFMAPLILFIDPTIRAAEAGKDRLALFFTMLNLGFTYFFLAAWCVCVFSSAIVFSGEKDVSGYYIPVTLLLYGLAISPLKRMAKADARMGVSESGVAVLFFCTASLVVCIAGYSGLTLNMLLWIYGVTVVFLLALMTFISASGLSRPL